MEGTTEDYVAVFLCSLVLFPAFISTIFFRLVLKSTAWFYLPLLFQTSSYDGQSRLVWMRSFPRLAISRVRLVLSLIAIGVAGAALIVDIPSAITAWQLGQAMDLPVVPVSLLLVLNWTALFPWQYASLATALLTLVLFFSLDRMGKREAAGETVVETGFALRSMVWTDRLRTFSTLAWLALITPPTLRFFYCSRQLPDWAHKPLEWIFDQSACAVHSSFWSIV